MSDTTKLLIVDDEIKFLDSIARRLEMRGFDVTKVSRGKEALEAAETGGFDLALLDLKMPGMDGKEVLRTLKNEHRYIEVIMLTGHGSIDSAVECTKLGAFSYLSKPCELDNLLEVLRDAYEARLKKKFASDQRRLFEIAEIVRKNTPEGLLTLLHELRKLDDDEK